MAAILESYLHERIHLTPNHNYTFILFKTNCRYSGCTRFNLHHSIRILSTQSWNLNLYLPEKFAFYWLWAWKQKNRKKCILNILWYSFYTQTASFSPRNQTEKHVHITLSSFRFKFRNFFFITIIFNQLVFSLMKEFFLIYNLLETESKFQYCYNWT